MSLNINWDEVIKKEARGIEDYDLGEVHEIKADSVVTKKGVLDKGSILISKELG